MAREKQQQLAALAAKHHGLFTRADTSSIGVASLELTRLVDAGHVVRLAPGVYRWAAAPVTYEQRLLAAAWAHGASAVVSHLSAAHVFGMVRDRPKAIHVTAARSSHRRTNAATVHSSRSLPPWHRTTRLGLPVTSAARTAFDVASEEDDKLAERVLDRGLALKLFTLSDLRGVFVELARRGRKGTCVFREFLQQREDGYIPPSSELEHLARKAIAATGLEAPELEVWLGDDDGPVGRVDMLWRAQRLVVELDGAEFHAQLSDARRDAERDRRLEAAGFRIRRFGWVDVADRPWWFIAELRRELRTPVPRPL